MYKMDSGGQNKCIKNGPISLHHGIWVLPGHVLCPQDLVGGQGILGSDQSYPRQNYNMVGGD